jgi:hypothetical protein
MAQPFGDQSYYSLSSVIKIYEKSVLSFAIHHLLVLLEWTTTTAILSPPPMPKASPAATGLHADAARRRAWGELVDIACIDLLL